MTIREFNRAISGNGLTREDREWLTQWWWDWNNGLYNKRGNRTSCDGTHAAANSLAQILGARRAVHPRV